MHACMYVCMYGMYVCMYVCMYVLRTYVCMHMYEFVFSSRSFLKEKGNAGSDETVTFVIHCAKQILLKLHIFWGESSISWYKICIG